MTQREMDLANDRKAAIGSMPFRAMLPWRDLKGRVMTLKFQGPPGDFYLLDEYSSSPIQPAPDNSSVGKPEGRGGMVAGESPVLDS